MPPRFHHFQASEIIGLDLELVAKLDIAREQAKIPFVIISGWRSDKKNLEAGGVPDSAHLRGLAVDLECSTGNDRWKMITALWDAGFTRIGIYSGHVHADLDPTLPQHVIWIGISH